MKTKTISLVMATIAFLSGTVVFAGVHKQVTNVSELTGVIKKNDIHRNDVEKTYVVETPKEHSKLVEIADVAKKHDENRQVVHRVSKHLQIVNDVDRKVAGYRLDIRNYQTVNNEVRYVHNHRSVDNNVAHVHDIETPQTSYVHFYMKEVRKNISQNPVASG
jgi:uncharacterized protein YccT (UPF0319 family)